MRTYTVTTVHITRSSLTHGNPEARASTIHMVEAPDVNSVVQGSLTLPVTEAVAMQYQPGDTVTLSHNENGVAIDRVEVAQ